MTNEHASAITIFAAIGGVGFGFWQGSVGAAVFMFVALGIAIEWVES